MFLRLDLNEHEKCACTNLDRSYRQIGGWRAASGASPIMVMTRCATRILFVAGIAKQIDFPAQSEGSGPTVEFGQNALTIFGGTSYREARFLL